MPRPRARRGGDAAPATPARQACWARRAATGVPVVVLTLLVAGCTDSTSTPAKSSSTSASSSGGSTSSAAGSGSSSASSSAAGVGAGTGSLAQVPGVAARVQPSVVTVLVGGGNGSGVVYTADGLILTNEHVVRGSKTVKIAFADGRQVGGTVKAEDAVTDLALVKADRGGLPPARFQTRLPQVGALAVVLGSPLGFQNTVTAGIISGLHREIPGSAQQGQSLVDLIQTDAPISPGNSGGAVVDADGAVIGISEAYIPPQSGAVALGFAIPAATAVDVAGQLQRNGRARHAFAGIVPSAITPEIAQQLGLKSTDGTVVAEVSSGGPAARAGLSPGDVITAIDGKATATPEDFLAALRPHKPGDTITLTIHRPGKADQHVKLTLTDRPTTTNP